jgi:curved DNA-binding protein CbpA
MTMTPALRALVERLHAALERSTHYDLLGVPRNATRAEIQAAFYRRADALHPDRHLDLDDAALRAKVQAVYKRVAEAYRALSDVDARREYDAGLARGARPRPTGAPAAADDAPRARPTDPRSPKAHRFFQAATEALAEGQLSAAKNNVLFALSIEPGSPMLRRLYEDILRRIAAAQGKE